MTRIGPAGWSYPDWEGRVYPRHKPPGFHALAFLARWFDLVEIDATFYAQPRAENSLRWVQLAAQHERFRFTAKLLKDFTHAPEPDDPHAWTHAAEQFRRGLEPLWRAKRLWSLLAQFPASYHWSPTHLRRIGRLRSLFDPWPMTVELRHRSWYEPPQLDSLRGLGVTLAHIDLPPSWNHPPAWFRPFSGRGYLRLHGRNEATWFREGVGRDARYDYLYSSKELDELHKRAMRIAGEVDELAVVTNNHFRGAAVANALELAALLSGGPVAGPAEIAASYPHLAPSLRVEGQQNLF